MSRQAAVAVAIVATVVVAAFCVRGAIDPAAIEWRFAYDGEGRLTGVVHPGGGQTRYQYEVGDERRIRRVSAEFPGGIKTTIALDGFERRSSLIDSAGTVRYEYDGFDRLTKVSRQGVPSLSYSYDTLGRMTGLAVGDQFRLQYGYDFLGRLTRIDTPAGAITYEYQGGSRAVVRALPNGVRTIWRYGEDDLLESITHADAGSRVLLRYTYSYREEGRIGGVREWSPQGERVLSYEYDALGRLASAVDSLSGRTEYRYDRLGNRSETKEASGNTIAAEYDWASRLQLYGGQAALHDAEGNLTNLDGRHFEYDGRGLLRAATTSKGKSEYEYDGDGYLIARATGGARAVFVPDPLTDRWQPLAALAADRKPAFYVWEGDLPLLVVAGAEAKFFLHDHLGSVRLVLDGAGKPVERFNYGSFGDPQREPEAFQPGFQGMFYDPIASAYLTRARVYDPRLGRFLQPEPAPDVPVVSPKELSGYGYCGCDPVNSADVTGGECEPRRQTFPERLLGPWLDKLGEWTNSNWIGPHYSAGKVTDQQMDRLGALPLGNTRTPGWWLGEGGGWGHDIRRWVNAHVPPGIEVKFIAPDGKPRYYTSGGFAWATPFFNAKQRTKNPFDLDRIKTIYPPSGTEKASGSLPRPPRLAPESRKYAFIPPPSNCLPFCDDDGGGGSGGVRFGPSPVGGVALGGSGEALKHLGALRGIAYDKTTGRWVLLAAEQGEIGLPPLRLEDIVTVFRSVYEHGEAPWVSIDPDPADPEGPSMLVRQGDGTANTYAGWVLFEADRVMKGYSLGADNVTRQPVYSAVPGYRNVFDLGFTRPGGVESEPVWERFWIVPAHVNRRRTKSGDLTLLDVPLRVNTQRMVLHDGKLVAATGGASSPEAAAFSEWFTAHYGEIAREASSPSPGQGGESAPVLFFQELQRIALLAAMAENLRDQGVPLPGWMREHPIQPVFLSRTTPAVKLEASRAGIQIRIYGGVDTGAHGDAVRTTIAAPETAALAPAVWRAIDSVPLLTPVAVVSGGERYQAVALPGQSARSVAPLRLEQSDLTVPVEDGVELRLTRYFHSFFAPVDVFGKGWTLDLPRLEKTLRPLGPTRGAVELEAVRQVTSPLSTYWASAPLLFEGDDNRLNGPSGFWVAPDGRRWYFNEAGNAVAQLDDRTAVFYRRDAAGRILRVEGWRGNQLRADIRIEYDERGRISAAQGSNGARAEYQYNRDGMLEKVKRAEETAAYEYQGGLVSAVYRNDRQVGSYAYAAAGRLAREVRADGTEIVYELSQRSDGVEIAAKQAGRLLETARFDTALRPMSRRFEDGTRAEWKYGIDGAATATVQPRTGGSYVVNRSADRRQITWRLAEGAVYGAGYDAFGRLTALQMGGRTVVNQKWLADGRLELATYETFALHPTYREDGVLTSLLLTPPELGPRFNRWLNVKLDEYGQPAGLTDYSGADISVARIGFRKTGLAEWQISSTDDGRLASVRAPNGPTMSYAYDSAGRVTAVECEAYGLRYAYDAQGRLASVTQVQGLK